MARSFFSSTVTCSKTGLRFSTGDPFFRSDPCFSSDPAESAIDWLRDLLMLLYNLFQCILSASAYISNLLQNLLMNPADAAVQYIQTCEFLHTTISSTLCRSKMLNPDKPFYGLFLSTVCVEGRKTFRYSAIDFVRII